MRIKLAILDQDANYLTRITNVFTSKFSDKLEIYSFSDLDVAISKLEDAKINVFIASDNFEMDETLLPRHCGFAYFVDSAGIETYKKYPAICKYQKVESIYKTILEIFSDNVSESIGLKWISDSSARVITFASASGGVGCSTAAAACAKSLALAGRKTLYINLEQFGCVDRFFTGEGQANFDDVIYALKSQQARLSLKLESCVKQDVSGVCFYSSPKSALDVADLKASEMSRLMADLKLTGCYENIVIDVNFSLCELNLEVLGYSDAIIFVLDGADASLIKFTRAYHALEILERQGDITWLPRVSVFYNKFNNKTGKTLKEGIPSIGGAPPYEQATAEQVIEQLVGLGIFQQM